MVSSSKQPGMTANKSILTPVTALEGHEPYIVSSSNGSHVEYKDVSYISYFPDRKQMISASRDKTIRQWDLREGKETKEVREVYENDIRAVGVSRDGRWVVTAVGGVLKVREVETGIMRTFHEDLRVWIKCFDISADSTLVAGGSIDGRALVWSLDTGKVVAGPLKCSDGYVCALRLLDDSKSLAVMSNWGKRLQVWDVQAQKLDVSREESAANDGLPLPWRPTSDDTATTIYELDASTLKAVGDSFKGHTKIITGLALSADYVLLASASDDDTIKLWSFESRQLLASFDVHAPCSIMLSPDSCQLAYTTQKETKIYVCDISANIPASIDLAKETTRDLAKLLESDATRHAVRRKPAISVISPVHRPLIDRPQPIFLRFLRQLLPSSRMDTVRPNRTDEYRNPLDFPATAPLPRPPVNPHENPSTTQSSAPAFTSFKSRLHHLSTWSPFQTDHTSPAIVNVSLAQGKERNAAAGAPRKNDEWIPYEDHVSPPPSPNPDSRQSNAAGQIKTNTGEHGSSRLCFCF